MRGVKAAYPDATRKRGFVPHSTQWILVPEELTEAAVAAFTVPHVEQFACQPLARSLHSASNPASQPVSQSVQYVRSYLYAHYTTSQLRRRRRRRRPRRRRRRQSISATLAPSLPRSLTLSRPLACLLARCLVAGLAMASHVDTGGGGEGEGGRRLGG